MFKKPNRLTTNFQFNITKKYGRKEYYGIFNTITLAPKNYVGPSQIGIIVPNSVHKRATKRNKIKRQLREALRKNITKVPNNLWIVIYASNTALNKSYEEISTQIDKFIQKISLTN